MSSRIISYTTPSSNKFFCDQANHNHKSRSHPAPPHPSKTPLPSAALPIRTFVTLALPLLGYFTYIFSAPSTPETLNPQTFTQFTLLSHQQISSTSSILTLRPTQTPSVNTNGADQDPYAEFWNRGTWSIEIKQPQLQIARRYTPLPATLIASTNTTRTSEANDAQAGDIRLLIRKYEMGEVSRYLHNLKPGVTVEVRGGYTELEVPEETQRVLFLAGGTGIAPAVQVASCLARRGMQAQTQAQESKIGILWANRRAEDALGGSAAVKGGEEMNEMVAMMRDLEDKAEKVADVEVKTIYFVDEENRFIQQKDVVAELARLESDSKTNAIGTTSAASMPAPRHEKLILISGPDGFVEYFAGPKRLTRDGREANSVTGGLLSQMKIDGWTVVRL